MIGNSKMQGKNLAYRPDIDGLRALAVLAVVIYHLNKKWLPGGFVGVDIFFVISGFLITGILKKEMADGCFSFYDFYMRRVRRILPAALTTIFVTSAFGILILLPSDLVDLSKSSLAAAASLANIYYWLFLDTSYFASSSETVPLLHMWSLGVEEQFYLVWPGLMYVVYKLWRTSGVAILGAALAVLSFVVSELSLPQNLSFAYYMLPSRAGELLVGALLFVALDSCQNKFNRSQCNALSALGLVGLIASVVLTSESGGKFPGVMSLLPSISTALIIAGGHGSSAVSKLLSVKPLVRIGLVSFSLYLWHWPVMAYFRYIFGQPSSLGQYLICVAIIITLTIVSYLCVERPFRYKASSFGVRRLYLPVMTTFSMAIAIFMVLNSGYVSSSQKAKFEKEQERVNRLTASAFAYKNNCQYRYAKQLNFDDKRCLLGDSTKAPTFLMFGDSHSAHYTGYMSEIANLRATPIFNASLSACIPLPQGADKYVHPSLANECVAFNKSLFNRVDNFDTIMISAAWSSYLPKNKDFEKDIEAMVAMLVGKGKNVILGVSPPVFNKYDKMLDIKKIKLGEFVRLEWQTYRFTQYPLASNIIFNVAKKYSNVYVFDLKSMICPSNQCSPLLNGVPIYYDGGHLSISGSQELGRIAIREKTYLPQLLY